MNDDEKLALEAKSKDLRAQLKTWETAWANTHEGRKPGREDIKQNVDIARKYKDYNRIRDTLSGKQPPAAQPARKDAEPVQRRNPDANSFRTPSKKRKHFETPSKPSAALLAQSPSATTPSIARNLFSPAAPKSIGPTPQRDGRVLGLFDLLVERELGTPSKGNGVKIIAEGPEPKKTPRKRSAADMEENGQGENEEDDDDGHTARRLGRTPMSTSKRQMLDHFMTPLKRRDANAQGGSKTPMSATKLQFSTPAFLKRHGKNLPPAADENGALTSPAPLRLPRKPLGRGLSAIVASLRKVEEEALDDDMEALREMEGGSPVKPKAATNPNAAADKQAPTPNPQLPLGGFDDESMYDSEPEEQLDRGQPLKIFKKKGQKRTTRLNKMKPVYTKRPANSAEDQAQHGDEDDEDEKVIPETQHVSVGDHAAAGDENDDFVPSDIEGSDAESGTAKRASRKAAGKDDGPVKKAAKKANALVRTNFRRLKLKNTGAKGGTANSRFRRRR